MKLTAALLHTRLKAPSGAAFALMVPATSSAQSVDVTITGIVTDPSGAVRRGVTVTATNRQTSLCSIHHIGRSGVLQPAAGATW